MIAVMEVMKRIVIVHVVTVHIHVKHHVNVYLLVKYVMVQFNVQTVRMKQHVNVITMNTHVMVHYVLMQHYYVMDEWIVPKVMMKHIQVAVSEKIFVLQNIFVFYL